MTKNPNFITRLSSSVRNIFCSLSWPLGRLTTSAGNLPASVRRPLLSVAMLFLSAIMLNLTIACQKSIVQTNDAESSAALTQVKFKLSDPRLKSVNTNDEDAVNNLQIFVFNTDGNLEAYSSEDATSLSLTCTTGEKDVYAIVNAPALNAVYTLQQLKESVSELADNQMGNLVMSGTKHVELSANATVEVEVSRLVAKITLSEIKTEFTLQQHKDLEFRILSVHLQNVPTQQLYCDGNYTSHRCSLTSLDADAPEVTYKDAQNTLLPPDQLLNTAYTMYSYSTITAGNTEAVKLILKTSLGGAIYYYPVELPALQSNNAYTVSLKITRPGALSPEVEVDSNTLSSAVDVKPWGDGGNISEII